LLFLGHVIKGEFLVLLACSIVLGFQQYIRFKESAQKLEQSNKSPPVRSKEPVQVRDASTQTMPLKCKYQEQKDLRKLKVETEELEVPLQKQSRSFEIIRKEAKEMEIKCQK